MFSDNCIDKLRRQTAITLTIWSMVSAQAYDFAGGNGESGNPYQIATAEQLTSIGSDPNLLDKHFVLLNDIHLDPNLPGGRVFTEAVIAPDSNEIKGFQGSAFVGVFDGAGWTVSNLTIRGRSYLGLFGFVGTGAEVKNLEIENADITGTVIGVSIAALAGSNDGNISGCHVSGHVAGGSDIGGLVGLNMEHGLIARCGTSPDNRIDNLVECGGGLVGLNLGAIVDSYACGQVTNTNTHFMLNYDGGLVGVNYGAVRGCYARTQVTGGDYLGGLVGLHARGRITDCYAAGNVFGTGDPSLHAGGLVGSSGGGVVTRCYATGQLVLIAIEEKWHRGGLIGGNSYWMDDRLTAIVDCFWNTDASDIHVSEGGIGLTTEQMMAPEAYSLHGWGGDPNWVLDSGKDYPRLAWEGTPGWQIPIPAIDWFQGSGTPDDPYVIVTGEQLARIGTASVLWDKDFVLAADVNLAGIDFPRIGVCRGTGFSGTFNGTNHVIDNLTVDTGDIPDAFNVGMFGYIGSKGLVHHLTLRGVIVRCEWGPDYVGTLAGVNEGSITDCFTGGSVSTGAFSTYVGQLVGHNAGSIGDCSSTATVSVGSGSYLHIGGLAGGNDGTITSSGE